MSTEPGKRRRKKHKRDVSYREKHFDLEMELRRKCETDSFLRIVSELFAKLSHDKPVKGTELARRCNWVWSEAMVWQHLRWLGDYEVIERRFDAKQLWFQWPAKRSKGAEYLYSLIKTAIEKRYPPPKKRPRRRRSRGPYDSQGRY